MSRYLPDRWLNYSPVGERIEGTRFIAFKVPLSDAANENVAVEKSLTMDALLQRVPTLGMIIDLTNKQDRPYYKSEFFEEKGIEHVRVKVPGHIIPRNDIINKFKLTVLSFLNKNSDNDKLIGVHCTHGVNRTGFMICYYMITELSMKPADAIRKFNAARGHGIERENYLEALYALDTSSSNRNSNSNRNSSSNRNSNSKRSPKRYNARYSTQGHSRRNRSCSREKYRRAGEEYKSTVPRQKHPLDNWRIRPLADDRDTYKLRNVLRQSDSDIIAKIYEANFPPRPTDNWRDRRASDYRELADNPQPRYALPAQTVNKHNPIISNATAAASPAPANGTCRQDALETKPGWQNASARFSPFNQEALYKNRDCPLTEMSSRHSSIKLVQKWPNDPYTGKK